MLEIQLGSSVGVSAWAAMLWPLMAVYFIVKKMSAKVIRICGGNYTLRMKFVFFKHLFF